MSKLVTYGEVVAAAGRIRGKVHRTPLMTSSFIDSLFPPGTTLRFKCENLQKCGSFKPRGALNALAVLREKGIDTNHEKVPSSAGGSGDAGGKSGGDNGGDTVTTTRTGSIPPVATHSSGNHGQALAYAASVLGITCHVAVPRGAPKVKRAAMEQYGAIVHECGDTLAAREAALEEIVASTGARFVPPFNDPTIVAGQGTVALEMIEDSPADAPLDFIFVPVGGGGLISGCAVATRGASEGRCTVIGVEPELADDAKRSVDTGEIQPQCAPVTIADGLRTALGPVTFPHVRDASLVREIVLVSEQEIADAMRLIMERMKLVVEPSGAVALAGAIKMASTLEGKSIGIVICGGNLDLTANAAAKYWTD